MLSPIEVKLGLTKNGFSVAKQKARSEASRQKSKIEII
jgi:hypothetical protein